MTDRNSIIGKVDWPLLLMYFALVIIGWLSVYSAGLSEGSHPIYDMSQFSGKQMMWMGIAFAIGFIILLLDAKLFDAFAFLDLCHRGADADSGAGLRKSHERCYFLDRFRRWHQAPAFRIRQVGNRFGVGELFRPPGCGSEKPKD